MSEKDGGFAFPSMCFESMTDENRLLSGLVKDSIAVRRGGMTLRDYFAAAVVGDVLQHPNATNGSPEEVARCAYAYADAMLKERDK